jgi:hypothetical protein
MSTTPRLCACGCGRDPGVYARTWERNGVVHQAGAQRQFVNGHHRRGFKPANAKDPSAPRGHIKDGYRILYQPDHPLADKYGRVAEHRLVANEVRPLGEGEVVHHGNHVRDDNRDDNLTPLAKPAHDRLTVLVAERCQIEGCDQPHRARGLCASHYGRFSRSGQSMPLPPSRGNRWTARVEKASV